MIAGLTGVAALFESQRQIEMHVWMRGHEARGVAQIIDGLIDVALFFEDATEVVARNAVFRVDLHGGNERIAGLGKLAGLIIRDAEIDVSFDPMRGLVDDAAIGFDGLGQQFR